MSFGQAPDWSWVKSSGGTKISNTVDGYGNEAYAMAADANGNVYVAGYFLSATIIFDSDTLFNTSSANDIFVVKYDNNGNVLWARSVGGSDNDSPNSVATDAYGNVYIAGFYKSSEIIFGNDTLRNSGYTDLFILKFDPAGNPLWARGAKGINEDIATSVSVDNSDNVYMTGYFQSPEIIFGSDTLTDNGSSDIFIIKYTPDGNVIWADAYGRNMEDRGNSIAVDANGNVFAGGAFKGSYIAFGADTLFNSSANGYSDMFLTKFDSSGSVLWARRAGSLSDERLLALTIDNSGDIFATGVFFSSTFSLGTTTLTNTFVNWADIFVSKWNTSGQVLWLKGAGGHKDDQALSLATDALGNLVLSICYNSPSIIISQDTLNDLSHYYNGAVADYDNNGNLRWTKNIGGNRDDGAFAVAVNSYGNIFVSGYFQSHYVQFDSIMLTSQDTAYSTAFIGSIEDILTGEGNTEVLQSFYVYPNPCNGVFTVRRPNTDDDVMLSIFNISGVEIFSEKNPLGTEKIDLSGFAKGIYFVRLEGAKEMNVLKLILE